MAESILTSMKKLVGIGEDYDAFDQDLIIHINSNFAELTAIGVGPIEGFMILDATPTWEEYLEGELRLNQVKSWMFCRLKLIFDPPQTGPLVAAYEKTAERAFGYLSIFRESQVSPATPTSYPVIDGGTDIGGME